MEPDATGDRAARKHDHVLLRSLNKSPDYFWHNVVPHRATLQVLDKNIDACYRELTDNEVAVMAFNEIAAHHGRGFFYYLPSRRGLTNPEREPLTPAGRAGTLVSANYPTLIFMPFVWSQATQDGFMANAQRARYLKCNAIINPPHLSTSIYAVQYVSFAKAPLWRNPKPTLVVAGTDSCFYVCSTAELEAIVGLWDKKKTKPSGPDPESRLNTMPYIWDSNKLNPQNLLKYEALSRHRFDDILAVYKEITRRCQALTGDVPATMTYEEVQRLIPRGQDPTVGGNALGSVYVDIEKPGGADPPSRRGTAKAGSKKRKAEATES